MPCPSIDPKWFWTVQIVLDGYKLFWSGPNRFGRVRIILVRFKLGFSGLIFIIWTCPKWFGPDQNKLHPSETIAYWYSQVSNKRACSFINFQHFAPSARFFPPCSFINFQKNFHPARLFHPYSIIPSCLLLPSIISFL